MKFPNLEVSPAVLEVAGFLIFFFFCEFTNYLIVFKELFDIVKPIGYQNILLQSLKISISTTKNFLDLLSRSWNTSTTRPDWSLSCTSDLATSLLWLFERLFDFIYFWIWLVLTLSTKVFMKLAYWMCCIWIDFRVDRKKKINNVFIWVAFSCYHLWQK